METILAFSIIYGDPNMLNKTAEAWAIQTGFDKQLATTGDYLISNIPKKYKITLDYLVPVADTLIKRKLEYSWNF